MKTLFAAVLVASVLAPAQLPPPPGMEEAAQRTMSCNRTLVKFDVIIASSNGPLSIDAAESARSYAHVSRYRGNGLIRTSGCRPVRRPAIDARRLGKRSTLHARFFEARQFTCRYSGPLVSHVAVSGGRGRLAVWTAGGRRLLALGEVRDAGTGWLRVAGACRLTYSR